MAAVSNNATRPRNSAGPLRGQGFSLMSKQPTQAQQAPYYPPYNSSMPNGSPRPGPPASAAPLLPNQGRVVQQGSTRILCVADIRGKSVQLSVPRPNPHADTITFTGDLKALNDLAKQARADCVIHTGDFGFYDHRSLERISDK